MSEIFDKRFVYFIWDDELEGKVCFAADNMEDLIFAVENDGKCAVKTNALRYSGNNVKPFHAYMLGANSYYFAYYDPNYEAKMAFNEGKTIQVRCSPVDTWTYCVVSPEWNDECEYRVKPEKEEKWIAYLNSGGYLTACKEDAWEMAQEDCGAKTKLFVGTENEVMEWYKARQKFAEVIKAWEDGKRIQVTPKGTDKWVDLHCEPTWDVNLKYRVMPEEKQYRPYESSAEMIMDFIGKFKIKCPPYCKPLIWVRLKVDKRERLIVTYGDNFVEIGNKTKAVTLQHLFEQYEFLDGSPCGMEVKE